MAVLSIGSGEAAPPLSISGFTPLVFDASRSTGEGLTYLLEFNGQVEWRSPVASLSQGAIALRLKIMGGPADGTTLEVRFADPY